MKPVFKLTVNGQNVTDRFSGVSRITITDKRGFEADTLSITVADPHGTVDLPDKGATIRVSIGFDGKTLHDKGEYIVDGNGYQTAPDSVLIYARSANIKESFNATKSRSFKETTLGGIIEKIARGQKTQPVISPDLAKIPIKHLDQTNESDGNLLARLGARYGALATVKDGRMVFTPLSRGNTVAGTPMEAVTIRKGDGTRLDYSNKQRASEFTRVKTRYHDLAEAKTIAVIVKKAGGAEGGKMKTLRATFPDEAQAVAAGEAELQRLSDVGTKCDIELAIGEPGVIPETPIFLKGFKPKIDGISWVCAKVVHTLNTSGLNTKLELVKKL